MINVPDEFREADMQITIYLDIIFCINFLTDYVILWMTSFFLRERVRRVRLFAGAFFGAGIMTLFLYIPRPIPVTVGVISVVGVSMGTVFLVFGMRGFMKKWFCTTTILFLAGSIMNYIKMITNQTVLAFCSWLVFYIVCVGVTMCICLMGKKILRMEENIYPIEISNAGKKVYCRVYLDTGHFLKDPLFGKPVLLISKGIAKGCLNENAFRMIEEYEKNGMINYSLILMNDIQQRNCFHEIEFYSIGNPSGKLLCFLVDELKVGGDSFVYKKQPVAVAPEYVFRKSEYQGLIHRDCF